MILKKRFLKLSEVWTWYRGQGLTSTLCQVTEIPTANCGRTHGGIYWRRVTQTLTPMIDSRKRWGPLSGGLHTTPGHEDRMYNKYHQCHLSTLLCFFSVWNKNSRSHHMCGNKFHCGPSVSLVKSFYMLAASEKSSPACCLRHKSLTCSWLAVDKNQGMFYYFWALDLDRLKNADQHWERFWYLWRTKHGSKHSWQLCWLQREKVKCCRIPGTAGSPERRETAPALQGKRKAPATRHLSGFHSECLIQHISLLWPFYPKTKTDVFLSSTDTETR